jgi:hypothetical protein
MNQVGYIPTRKFKTLSAAKKFARARIEEGYGTVRLYQAGLPRTKGYHVTVRYADKF